MKTKEIHSGISIQFAVISFIETKIKIEKTLYFKYKNFSSIFDNKKYKDRSPIIAKTLELKIINGSEVTAKIAGILSKANKRSVNSIVINAAKIAVKTLFHLVLLYLQ